LSLEVNSVNVAHHPVADAASAPLGSAAARPPIRHGSTPSSDPFAATTASARACRHCSERPRRVGVHELYEADRSRFDAFADVLADERGPKPAIELGLVGVVALAAGGGPRATEPVRPSIYLTCKKAAGPSAEPPSQKAGSDVAQ
jgi:hypothetical protein